MGKFKAGDRVRVLPGHPYVDVPETGTVEGKAGPMRRGKWAVALDGYDFPISFKSRELELLTAETEAWQPKVGDRVRATDFAPAGRDGVIVNRKDDYADGEWLLVEFDGWDGGHNGYELANGHTKPNRWFMRQRHIEPIPLTIEAGKFYRTRDGRKVGPMVKYDWTDGYPFSADGWMNYAAPDGRNQHLDVNQDLVAEWTDEPVASAAPSNQLPWRAPLAPTTDFIVARIVNGKPRPNGRPFVHATFDSAGKEAQRLADLHGDEFAVYQRVDSRTIDAGPVPRGFYPGDFDVTRAETWLRNGCGDRDGAGLAFMWSETPQGSIFWAEQCTHLTAKGSAILRKWVAEAKIEAA